MGLRRLKAEIPERQSSVGSPPQAGPDACALFPMCPAEGMLPQASCGAVLV